MARTIIAHLLLIAAAATAAAQGSALNEKSVPTYSAGGRSLQIPSPEAAMVEVGSDSRYVMELFVPESNRLLVAFVLKKDLPRLAAGDEDLVLERYAMVQVPRGGEHMDVGGGQFQEIVEGMTSEFDATVGSSVGEAEDEFNRRMADLDLDEMTLDLGEPVQLGAFFSLPDAAGFGLLMPVAVGDIELKMAMSMTLVRVKQRLLFVYLYAAYENPGTITYLRDASRDWAARILAANR